MLPFPEENGLRRFQCFVCGHFFEEFPAYNEHILASHDEGREYVRCPLPRCNCCVRDVRLHFAARHPTTPIPKNVQMRAMIWKDFSPKTGKMKTRKPKFREGYLVSQKNDGKQMHYRSGLECEVYECLEAFSEVVKYDVEPFHVQYSHEGQVHDYYPDLSVIFDDGHVEIWEIKPGKQTTLDKNKAKWAACQQYCEARGWQFVVLTEVGVGRLKSRLRQPEA